jgi:hypothetical protein
MKAVVPAMACRVLDRAIQLHGAAGVSQVTFLAYAYARYVHTLVRLGLACTHACSPLTITMPPLCAACVHYELPMGPIKYIAEPLLAHNCAECVRPNYEQAHQTDPCTDARIALVSKHADTSEHSHVVWFISYYKYNSFECKSLPWLHYYWYCT